MLNFARFPFVMVYKVMHPLCAIIEMERVLAMAHALVMSLMLVRNARFLFALEFLLTIPQFALPRVFAPDSTDAFVPLDILGSDASNIDAMANGIMTLPYAAAMEIA